MKQERIIRDGIEGRKNCSRIISVTENKITPALTFKSKKVQNLYNWWYSHGNIPPTKGSFDISEHLKDAEGYFLYSVLAEENFHVRLIGEQAINLLGHRYTDTYVNKETAKVDAHLDGLILYLQKILNKQQPYWCEGVFLNRHGQEKLFQSMDCPLWGNDENISHIVGVIEEVE